MAKGGRAEVKFKTNSAKARKQNFEGREHLVVPVVAVREGVLNGQLVLFEEFAAYPQAWEGIPLPVNHPQRGDQPVSANTPDILETDVIGYFFNILLDEANKSLKGELWIDTAKAALHIEGPEILRRLEAGEQLEVSTAYFADREEGTGVHNGEKYDGVQRNMRPDHLALLPTSKGACDWSDGCGAPRVNRPVPVFNRTLELATNKQVTTFTLNATSTISFDDTTRIVRDALNADDPGYYHWISDVYDDFVVYEKEVRVPMNGSVPAMPDSQSGLFRRDYSIKNEKVTLGDAGKVRRRTSYVDIPATNSQEAHQIMEIKTLIDALISNAKTPWKEEHRAMLMTFTECDLKALTPQEATPVVPAVNTVVPPVVPTPAPVVNQPTKPSTAKEFLEFCPPEMRSMFEQGLAANQARKAELVASLIKNTACAFSKAELESMELPFLEKVAAGMGVSYAGAPVPRTNTRTTELVDNDELPPDPPAVLTAPVTARK